MQSPDFSDDKGLPSAEDLDAIAEEQRIVSETSVNNVNRDIHVAKCFRCNVVDSLLLCRHCGNEFCSEHCSKYSDQYCYLCIAPDNLGLEYLPLEEEEVDEEGNTVTHRGRRIKLIGEGWPSSMQMVNDLSDEGLEIFIAERQRLLKEAVAMAEYHRITLSHAEFTKEYKRHSKAEKLQRRYRELQQGTIRLSGKAHRVGASVNKKQESEAEKVMKQLGLTAEQYKTLIKIVGKM